MDLKEFSIVSEDNVLIAQQISDHPNFTEQKIIREVVLEALNVSAKNNFERGYVIDYYINHYNNKKLETSMKTVTDSWTISDSLMIAERDFNSPTLEPLPNPDYEAAVLANQAGETISNPDYISDEELAMIPKNKLAPAFTYLLKIFKARPDMIWSILSFYIIEQDNDGFFDKY